MQIFYQLFWKKIKNALSITDGAQKLLKKYEDLNQKYLNLIYKMTNKITNANIACQ